MKSKIALSELFEQAKRALHDVPVGDIQSLVESGRTSPLAAMRSFRPRRITSRLFNPLRILIMIAPIIIITAALLTFNTTERKEPLENVRTKESKKEVISVIDAIPTEKMAPQAVKPEPKKLGVPVQNFDKPDALHSKDTVFKGVILDLTKEELTRLGFMFDEEGYYYLNKLPDGTKMNIVSYQSKTTSTASGSNGLVLIQTEGGSFGFASGGYVNKSNKSPLHEFDFYPVLTTDLNGEDLYPIDQIKGKVYTEFDSMNDTLVPVRFLFEKLGGYKTEDKLVWFKVSDHFFDLLKTEQSERARLIYNRAKALTHGSLSADRVDYNFVLTLPMNNAIRLKPEVLKCMGIDYSSESININIRAIEYWFNINLSIKNGETTLTGVTTEVNPVNSPSDTLLPTTESIILLGISNFGNMKIVDMPTRVYRQLNRKEMTFQQYLNLCIPVMIEGSKPGKNGKEVIFWIYPNERFFNCLPTEIAGPMKKEFEYQKYESVVIIEVMPGKLSASTPQKLVLKDTSVTPPKPVPCVYFTNLCESLPGLDYVNLYPNPATDKLNVDLVLQHGKKIRFRVFDLGGRMISDDGAPENYPEGGQFKHQVDISKLQSGFYLLVMTDEEGARETRRFVKN